MTHVLVRYELEDVERWTDAFEERRAVREDRGCRDETLFARSDNDRKVVLLAEWDTAANAEAYFDGDDFRDAVRTAGVVRKPDVTVLDRVEDVDVVSVDRAAVDEEPPNRESADPESGPDEPDR